VYRTVDEFERIKRAREERDEQSLQEAVVVVCERYIRSKAQFEQLKSKWADLQVSIVEAIANSIKSIPDRELTPSAVYRLIVQEMRNVVHGSLPVVATVVELHNKVSELASILRDIDSVPSGPSVLLNRGIHRLVRRCIQIVESIINFVTATINNNRKGGPRR
jgi:hypothetical protein